MGLSDVTRSQGRLAMTVLAIAGRRGSSGLARISGPILGAAMSMVAMTADLGAQVPVAPAVGGAGDRVRICTVQFAARPPAEAAGAMRQFIEKAAADGARLVVFPALTMPGGQAVEKAMGDTAAKARITVVTGVREIGPGGASDNRAVAFTGCVRRWFRPDGAHPGRRSGKPRTA